MEDFSIMYQILKALHKAMDFDGLSLEDISAERFHIKEPRWRAIMKMLCDNGFIEGVKFTYTADGAPIINGNTARITLQGLEYLEENSMMKKAYYTLKGLKEVIPGI